MLHHNESFISCGLKATSPDKQFYAYYFSYRYTVYYWQQCLYDLYDLKFLQVSGKKKACL